LDRCGRLAVFDGDYATTTVALTDHDPLQACVDAMMANSVNDRWFARRLPTSLSTAGFEQVRLRGHSFIETDHVDYLLSVPCLDISSRFQPPPIPKSARPPETKSTLASSLASRMGSRSMTRHTPVPSLIRVVAVVARRV
jgi:hypothetical protein